MSEREADSDEMPIPGDYRKPVYGVCRFVGYSTGTVNGQTVTRETWAPDPEAPSVAEVVEVLKEARGWCPQGESHGSTDQPFHPRSGPRERIDNLIARLEGA